MDIPDYMRDYGIGEDELAELTRIFVLRKGVFEKTLPRYVVPYEPSSLEEGYRLFTEVEEELMGKQGKPALRIVGVDWIAHFWGVEGAISLLNLDVRRIRYVGGLTILLGKPIYRRLSGGQAPSPRSILGLLEGMDASYSMALSLEHHFTRLKPITREDILFRGLRR